MADLPQVNRLPKCISMNADFPSLIGFMTQISRFPSNDLGIAVFSNDNEYGGMLHEIIKWYLVDTALGLPPIDWNTRSVPRQVIIILNAQGQLTE